MGFNAELQVVYPDYEVLGKGKTLWMAEEVIYLHGLTRLQKVVEGIRNPGAQTLMGICLMSILLGKLAEKLGAGVTVADFAPRFLIYTDPCEHHQVYEEAAKTDGHYLDCGTSYEGEGAWLLKPKNPSPEQRKKHNAWLCSSQSQHDHVALKNYIITSPLVMWEESRVVAFWLDEAQSTNTQEWQELCKNPVAFAKALGWREYLRHVGDAGAKVLFLFPRH